MPVTPFILTTLAGLSTGLGGVIAALFRPTPRLLAFCGGFAGAVMVTVSLADLAPSVMEFYGQSLSPLGCGFAVTGLLLGGMLTALFLGKALPGEETLAARFGSRAQGAAMRTALVTGAAVYALGRFMPDEPETIVIDPGYMHGLAAGVIGYLFGRSRRGAFIAGVVGVMLASVASAVQVWSTGVDQRLVLGGAGAFDVIVMSGLIAVLLSELIGEISERIKRGRQRPTREFKNGEFVRKESEK